MPVNSLQRWVATRFLPLSWLDYAAIAAAVALLVREVWCWLA
jgi:hypothetical protein